MKKEDLITVLKRLFYTDADLEFLKKLDMAELEMLIATIRDRIENRSILAWVGWRGPNLIIYRFAKFLEKPNHNI